MSKANVPKHGAFGHETAPGGVSGGRLPPINAVSLLHISDTRPSKLSYHLLTTSALFASVPPLFCG
jgi:hypothetical protein